MDNGGNCGMGVQASISENLLHSYTWPLEKRTHSYTRSPKCCPFYILPFDFLYPYIAGSQTNIAVNSLNTKGTSSLEKSLNK